MFGGEAFMARLPRGWEKSSTQSDKEEWKVTEKPYNAVFWERISRGQYEAKVRLGPNVHILGAGIGDKQDARTICQEFIRKFPKGNVEIPQKQVEVDGDIWTCWEDECWYDEERAQHHIDIVERWADKNDHDFEYLMGTKESPKEEPSTAPTDGIYVWYKGLDGKHPRDFLAMNSDYEWVGKSKNP